MGLVSYDAIAGFPSLQWKMMVDLFYFVLLNQLLKPAVLVLLAVVHVSTVQRWDGQEAFQQRQPKLSSG